MQYIQQIIEIASKNNGIITSTMVDDVDISRGILKYLYDQGKIEKVARGVYVLPGTWDDEYVNLQSRYKKGIYCLETSLFLLDLTDRTPIKYHMTFPSTYNLSNPKKDGIICKSCIEHLYNLGVTQLKTPHGNLVKSYDAERTICDILRQTNNIDIQIITEAIKRYVNGTNKNIPKLSEYAKILKVEKKIRSYLEVLL